MSHYPAHQLNLPGFVKLPPPWVGLRDVIAFGTLVNPGVAPSVREIAAALVVDEAKIRSVVDSMIENGVAVEQDGLVMYRLGAVLIVALGEAEAMSALRSRNNSADCSAEAARARHQAFAVDGG